MPSLQAHAQFGDLLATELVQVTDDPAALDSGGRWAVAIGFEGRAVFAKFDRWKRAAQDPVLWSPRLGAWRSSLERSHYEAAVRNIQTRIADGWVYQVNLCRILSAPCQEDSLEGLYQALLPMAGQFSGLLQLPDHDVAIASASPERFLTRRGPTLLSSPIKGTADDPSRFLPKDRSENIMIVDLVRNDLGRVAVTGTVAVRELLAVQPYPGLFHLVSTVSAEVGDRSWQEIFAATLPPGSVSGAPKHSALEVIAQVEPVTRQWYCGAFGWLDADTGEAELGVAIRTFWLDEGHLKFGTGAGITWGSDPAGEWQETELKARRLICLASGDSVAG